MPSQILVSGVSVTPGIVKARAKVINTIDDIYAVEDGDIVVLPCSNPVYAIAAMKASGVVCEAGGVLSHICTITMEMGIPCITQANDAMTKISNEQFIYLDASEGVVYANE